MAIDASDIIVLKSIRFRLSKLIATIRMGFICIYFQQRFQLVAFSRISVDGWPKRIEMIYAFENALRSVDRV